MRNANAATAADPLAGSARAIRQRDVQGGLRVSLTEVAPDRCCVRGSLRVHRRTFEQARVRDEWIGDGGAADRQHGLRRTGVGADSGDPRLVDGADQAARPLVGRRHC